MPHTLREAAKAVGRDRTTLMRAIRLGRLSATRDAATGAWLIEPAELHRVYPPVHVETLPPCDTNTGAPQGESHLRTPGSQGGSHGSQGDSQGELRELRARLADAQEQIGDLRRRLDRADERLTTLLTDQRSASMTAPTPARRWWPWGGR
jgi:hypothetical protein